MKINLLTVTMPLAVLVSTYPLIVELSVANAYLSSFSVEITFFVKLAGVEMLPLYAIFDVLVHSLDLAEISCDKPHSEQRYLKFL